MNDQEPKPLRWPLATVFATFLITGFAGCYYCPEDYGHSRHPNHGTYGHSRCHTCGGYHSPGQCRYHHKKYKHAKHANYKHPKFPKHPKHPRHH